MFACLQQGSKDLLIQVEATKRKVIQRYAGFLALLSMPGAVEQGEAVSRDLGWSDPSEYPYLCVGCFCFWFPQKRVAVIRISTSPPFQHSLEVFYSGNCFSLYTKTALVEPPGLNPSAKIQSSSSSELSAAVYEVELSFLEKLGSFGLQEASPSPGFSPSSPDFLTQSPLLDPPDLPDF